MSMSQEEIEALMNGLDFEEESPKQEAAPEEEKQSTPEVEEEVQTKQEDSQDTNVSDDDIDELLSQAGEFESNNSEDEQAQQSSDEDESLDDILNQVQEQPEKQDDIHDVLSEIEQLDKEVEQEPSKQAPQQSVNEVKEEPAKQEVKEEVKEEIKKEPVAQESHQTQQAAMSVDDDIDSKINSGVFPLPVDKDNKVVNQLSQVANDSEEKATKIFDVLSNILDYNNNIQSDVQELATFNAKQMQMLDSLNQKFPNIDAFKQNLEQAQKMGNFISDINEKINNGNMEIFQAMELMQYHDINRQKIERVMSVIRKLTIYLNNLFEDETDYQEIAVAKHIHGDSSTGDLMAEDDLDALISEFNK